jgi:hypothetical protein
MAFWEGIKKIFSGIEDIASTPAELLVELKCKRRDAFSGKYTVRMEPEYGHPALVAEITFNGGANMHDIDRITYANGTVDIWDELSSGTKAHVGSKINSFLRDLMSNNRSSPLH